MAYHSTTIAHRGKVARLLAQVHEKRPADGEATGTLRCLCGAPLRFTVQSAGRSSGHCTAGCGVRWAQ